MTRRAHSRILAKTPARTPSSSAPEAPSAGGGVVVLDAPAAGVVAAADASRVLASASPKRIRRNHARAPGVGGDDTSVDSDSANARNARNSAAVSSFTRTSRDIVRRKPEASATPRAVEDPGVFPSEDGAQLK